jgi:catechol 2,3-dioxygenase-like lactoylglutathione lyase family enzyme
MRLQLALNVDDLDTAIDFYSKMFATPPAKVREGYANFAIENPPLKLVLFEGAGESGSINHLGVEVESADEVTAAEARLSDDGIETTGVDDTVCCFAEKTETWVHAPDGNRWEWYVKRADAEQLDHTVVAPTSCCP